MIYTCSGSHREIVKQFPWPRSALDLRSHRVSTFIINQFCPKRNDLYSSRRANFFLIRHPLLDLSAGRFTLFLIFNAPRSTPPPRVALPTQAAPMPQPSCFIHPMKPPRSSKTVILINFPYYQKSVSSIDFKS